MITIPVKDFVFPSEPYIGILSTEKTVTIFYPGDEGTSEWIALHPLYIPSEVPE